MKGLYRHGILSFLGDHELLRDSEGQPLVNGMFGVPKADPAGEHFDLDTCLLRLIINLVPSNEIQHVLQGEIKSLPLFSQWLLLELLGREYLVISSEDMHAAFYLFGLPREWWKLFVLAEPISPELAKELGLPAGQRWPCVIVVPMGWASASGLMEHLHNQLIRFARLKVPAAQHPPWLARATQAAPNFELRWPAWTTSHGSSAGAVMPWLTLTNCRLRCKLHFAKYTLNGEWPEPRTRARCVCRSPWLAEPSFSGVLDERCHLWT